MKKKNTQKIQTWKTENNEWKVHKQANTVSTSVAETSATVVLEEVHHWATQELGEER